MMTKVITPALCSLGLMLVAAAPMSHAAPAKAATTKTTAKTTTAKKDTKTSTKPTKTTAKTDKKDDKKADTAKKKTPAKTTKKSTSTTKTSSSTTSVGTVPTTTINESTTVDTSATTPIVPVAEPTLSEITYQKASGVSFIGTDLTAQSLPNIPLPMQQISNVTTLPTVIVPSTQNGTGVLDVSVFDDFINYVSPMARHYPPVFASRTDRYNATERVKQLSAWIEPYAQNPNASYDVLLRAAKINGIGRNLDFGPDVAVRASNYVARALKIKDTAEANFLYGVMLAEGGGFKEGAKYLNKAESMGYAEATQSLAQADLLDDNRPKALQRLNDFKAKYPDNPYIDNQLAIVNSGKYYIWDIPAKAADR